MKKEMKQIKENNNSIKVIELFRKNYGSVACALVHKNAFELLIATILSAQCTDQRVNQVTPLLFEKYPNPLLLSKAKLKDIESLIHSIGFYRTKAKNLILCSQMIQEQFKGQVPQSHEELTHLAGVGNKTANVVMGVGFGVASGIVVDTHVKRLSWRLGWVKTKNVLNIQNKLQEIIKKEDWIIFSLWMIEHGRKTCKARKPLCEECFLVPLCGRHLNDKEY